MKIKEQIHAYLQEVGFSQEQMQLLDSSSVYIAQQIALYAHRNQKRVNGENYFVHPYKVMNLYREFVGIVPNDYFCVDLDLLTQECHIPYEGVQEVCLLHDVLEDTEVTLSQIEEVYQDLGLGEHFRMYIQTPLLLVTHDKSEDYFAYIGKLIDNPVASMVKFMDMVDNITPHTLKEFGEKELKRIEKYAFFAKMLNDKWHFTENIYKYTQLLKEKRRK